MINRRHMVVVIAASVSLAFYTSTAAARGQYGRTIAIDTDARLPAFAGPPDPGDAEVRTMAKVIEDSIDQSGLKDWQGSTHDNLLFGPTIRSQYVPTVGAIFTVPVNFRISEPEPVEAETPQRDDDAEDLWAKHAEGGETPLSRLFSVEQEAENQTARVLLRGKRVTFSLPESEPEYDPAKLDAMRRAIIQALAQYGHHLKRVAEEERILVILEAQSPLRAPGPEQVRDYVGHLEELQYRLTRMSPHIAGFLGDPAAKDHRLIAVRKADVAVRPTYDDLREKVEEVAY